MRRVGVPLAAFLIGVAALAAALVFTLAPSRETPASAVGGPFALVNQDGRPVTEKDFAGQPYLVFFGFTHCPDVCPTTLFQISEVLKAAGPKGQGLKALFITVDPERDTPEVLKSYLGSFDERIVGLTGDRTAVDAAIRTFRAFSRKVPGKDGDYAMDHSSTVYLMDGKHRLVGSFNLNRAPDDAARDLLSQV
ncbi:MAG TPA: SCO family protein [Microvirga sp.]